MPKVNKKKPIPLAQSLSEFTQKMVEAQVEGAECYIIDEALPHPIILKKKSTPLS